MVLLCLQLATNYFMNISALWLLVDVLTLLAYHAPLILLRIEAHGGAVVEALLGQLSTMALLLSKPAFCRPYGLMRILK